MSEKNERINNTARKRRTNKMIMDADYNPVDVHETTRMRWEKKLKQFRSSKSQNDTSGIQTGERIGEHQTSATLLSSIDIHLDSNPNIAHQSDSSLCGLDMEVANDLPASETEKLLEIRKLTHGLVMQEAADDTNFLTDESSNSESEDNGDSNNDQQEKNKDLNDFKTMSHVVMFPESQLSTRDVTLMVMAYSIRFHSTYEGRDALFEMCKTFAGPTFENWNTTKYVINQLYDPPDEVVSLCFLCTNNKCLQPLLPPTSKRKFKKYHVKCACGSEYYLTTQSSNYVVSIDLKFQIEALLKDVEIRNALLKGIADVKNRENKSGDIRDVYDGQLYKEVQKEFSHVSHLVTYNFSTDGAPVCNSETLSFWPTQLTLNELPPKLRFKYPLLAALSMDKKEPSPEFMNAYMHFVNQAHDLAEKGIQITDENGIPVTLTVVPLCCPVDSVARPILQNRLQYNGYSGCSWCYQKGLYDEKAMRYPVQVNDDPLRTDEGHWKDLNDLKHTEFTTVNGVKGFSILLTLLTFDIVWGFPIDYLHAELLGVVKYLWDTWVETKVISQDGIRQLNERLLKMTPPHEIHRLPRPIKNKAKWKASEWRSWLLFYSVICLQGLVPADVLQHYQLLIDSVFILLQESISERELRMCEKKLLIFVTQCQEMFGNRVMTFNVHSLLHLVESVRRTGPLWASSTFPYENAIFYLKRAITGPKGRYDQIAKNTLLMLTFNNTCQKLASSETGKRYCEKLFSHRDCKTAFKTTDEVLLFGPVGEMENGTQLFNRCVYKSSVFHSTKYCRPTKTNDTVVTLTSQEIGEIQDFHHIYGKTYVSLSLFTVVPDQLITVAHVRKVVHKNVFKTVPIECIRQKMVILEAIDSRDFMYVCRLPNNIEIQ